MCVFQGFEVSSMFIHVDFLLNELQILLVTKINEITVIRLNSNQFWLFIDIVGINRGTEGLTEGHVQENVCLRICCTLR